MTIDYGDHLGCLRGGLCMPLVFFFDVLTGLKAEREAERRVFERQVSIIFWVHDAGLRVQG